MILPANLVSYMRDVVPGFAKEEDRHQLSLAKMLWTSTQPHRQHIGYDGMFSFSKRDARRVFSSDGRMRLLLAGRRYFDVLSGGNLDEYTNGFVAKPQMAEALRRCLDDRADTPLLDDDAREMRALPRAIASRSGAGNRKSKWSGLAPANSVRIDLGGLLSLHTRLEGMADEREFEDAVERRRWVHKRRVCIDALVRLARNRVCPGSIPIRYVEMATGRIYASGLSLQTAPREVRNAALGGCWDYDLSNCHWALIDELARAQGLDCVAIRHYLSNKVATRGEIAAYAGITATEAKECLLMVVYGAPASPYWDGAIVQHISEEKARRLFKAPAFIALHNEVQRARKRIISSLPVLTGGWVVNPLGLRVPRASMKMPELLAHHLQGFEAKALMAVVREQGSDVQLCVHDGWVTKTEMDIARVERLIAKEIGVEVKVEGGRIEPLPGVSVAMKNHFVHSAKPPQAQHPCGFPGIDLLNRAPNALSGALGLPPGKTGPPAQPSGLVLTRRPSWSDVDFPGDTRPKHDDWPRQSFVW